MNTLMIEGESVPCEFVLFDLDGTILDDMVRYRTMARARFEVIRDGAGTEAAERWAELSGVDTGDYSVNLMGPLAKAPRKEDITVGAAALWPRGYRWYEAMQIARQLYEEADRLQETRYVPILFEGVAEALRGLKAAGLRLGIATNGSGKAAKGLMAVHGLEKLFEVFVGADMVEAGKPDPEMILFSCEMAGIPPTETVYVGDSPADMMAGRSAGCRAVIAVNHLEDGELTRLADISTESVADLRAS
jgi:HAD superfamily hydrolase (TIGR01549 family)